MTLLIIVVVAIAAITSFFLTGLTRKKAHRSFYLAFGIAAAVVLAFWIPSYSAGWPAHDYRLSSDAVYTLESATLSQDAETRKDGLLLFYATLRSQTNEVRLVEILGPAELANKALWPCAVKRQTHTEVTDQEAFSNTSSSDEYVLVRFVEPKYVSIPPLQIQGEEEEKPPQAGEEAPQQVEQAQD